MTSTNDSTTPPLDYARDRKHFDPDDFRMSIGEHLEELRKRLFYGLIGFAVAFVFWFLLGARAVDVFLRPLQIAFARAHLQQQIYFTDVAEKFMTYIRVSMVLGLATAAPWLVYQLWLFVAAGLYPKERKYVTKYLPLSIVLLISGMLFLYFYVLPLMLEFFLVFQLGSTIVLPHPYAVHATTQPAVIPMLHGKPPGFVPGSLWFDVDRGLLEIGLDKDDVRILAFGSGSLVSPMITLQTYIDMVIGMLLSFGLAFQMPLIVLALNKIGIMDLATLRKFRRMVYFSMSIIAAVIVPDVATGMVALLIPLILLYELGILLAAWSQKKAEKEAAAT